MQEPKQHTILIVGTNMMNLYHHRLELIKALLDQNYDVVVAAPKGGEEKNLEKLGCRFIDTPVDNRGTNIKNDLGLLSNLSKIIKSENPSVVLTFYTKTNIYGGLVARHHKIPYIENMCGLGTSLVGKGLLSKMMARLYKSALKKSSIVFFQNRWNIEFVKERKIYKGEYDLLPGSGVSLTRYTPLPYPKSDTIEFLFASRVMKEKGIEEYIEAARQIRKKYPQTVFHVVGPSDEQYIKLLEDSHKSGIIKYHGKVMDLHPFLEKTHCSIHPSYYPEGMANILLESAASGRPVITTPLPGCGETVEDGLTGFLIEPKNPNDLAEKIEKFINLSPDKKKEMGLAGRKKMELEFDRDIVTQKYLVNINRIINEEKARS